MRSSPARLNSADWLAVLVTVGLMLGLSVHAYRHRTMVVPGQTPVKSKFLHPAQTIRVFVDGAVKHPRFYDLPSGSTMGDLLKQVELSDQAVTYALRKRTPLEDRQTVVIPHRKRKKRG